jgi:hypothetical protein
LHIFFLGLKPLGLTLKVQPTAPSPELHLAGSTTVSALNIRGNCGSAVEFVTGIERINNMVVI